MAKAKAKAKEAGDNCPKAKARAREKERLKVKERVRPLATGPLRTTSLGEMTPTTTVTNVANRATGQGTVGPTLEEMQWT